MIPFLLIIFGMLTVVGVINRTGSICSGRRGVRFFQPLYNVCAILRKGAVISQRASVVSALGPIVSLAALIVAALIIPLGTFGAAISFGGDVILFCALMATARVAMVATAMDSGGSFQGMGSARDAFFSMLVEPALYMLLATLTMITGYDSLSGIFAQFDNMSLNGALLSIVVGYGFLKLALVECSRVPVSDPATHLELTMTHSAMVLDLSGFDLAIVHISGWLKLSIFSLLLFNSLIPAHMDGWPLFALYLGIVFVFGVAVGVGESMRARNRMNKNSTYIASITAIGVLAFIVAYMLATNHLIA
ncbi:MAG: NADH-quinone oxidoreductase subunit H [Mucinivorans sp.]